MEDVKVPIVKLLTKDNIYANNLLIGAADADGNLVFIHKNINNRSYYQNVNIGILITHNYLVAGYYMQQRDMKPIQGNSLEECFEQYSAIANNIPIRISESSQLHDGCNIIIDADADNINEYKYNNAIIDCHPNIVGLNFHCEILIVHDVPVNMDLYNIKAKHIIANRCYINNKLNTEYAKIIECNKDVIQNNSCGSVVYASINFADVFALWPQLVAYNDGNETICNPNHPYSQYFPVDIKDIKEAVAQYETNIRRILGTKKAS